MSKGFYFRMAFHNIRRNKQSYLPFLMTCIGSLAMYYIMGSLSVSPSLREGVGGEVAQIIMTLGKGIIGIFSAIFLFYTNSFLLKRRKKEFGLYNILGMGKGHIAVVMFLEMAFTAFFSVVFGLMFGILLYKGVYLLLLRILHFEITLGFEISWSMTLETILFFGGIFLLLYLNALRQIHMSSPAELLKGGQTGEREPKTKWFLTLIGFLCLGIGYYLAVTTTSPMDALFLFFVAVVFVMIGTYALFTAGSIFILKALRKNKNYYYQVRHFTTVSGMIYRLKQNAAGLASISIMSTAVLLMVSSTVCMYFGMEDLVRTRFPRNLIVQVQGVEEEQVGRIDQQIEAIVKKQNGTIENLENYRKAEIYVNQNGNEFAFVGGQQNYQDSRSAHIHLLSLADYNRLTGSSQTLKEDELLAWVVSGKLETGSIQFAGREWTLKEQVTGLDSSEMEQAMMVDSYFFVLPTMEEVVNINREALKVKSARSEKTDYLYAFDLELSDPKQKILEKSLWEIFETGEFSGFIEGAASSKEDFYMLYGSMMFIGIFLGLLFLMATVLIIYYKQVSEGYEDHDRFVIMQKVGMSSQEVKQSINSQVRTVFLLPVLMAGIHIIFAFPMISRILIYMNMNNQRLFAFAVLITFLVFLLFYGIVYSMTAKTYYKLVRW